MSWVNFLIEQWALVAGLVALTAAYFFLNADAGGKSVSIHDVSRLLNADQAILLDVREAADFKSGHITGAVNVSYSVLPTKVEELEKYKAKTIIVADKMGQHSAAAGKILLDKGFTVVRLSGGMSEWIAQSLPVVKKK